MSRLGFEPGTTSLKVRRVREEPGPGAENEAPTIRTLNSREQSGKRGTHLTGAKDLLQRCGAARVPGMLFQPEPVS